MKKQILPKILLATIFAFISIFSLAQQTTSTNCTDPAKGCDTVGIEHKVSPWRVGGFIGPAVAFCGSWESTFNSNKYRDKALFNGIGFNAALNADYFFNIKKEKQVKFGVGAVAGLQNFFFRKDINPFIDKIIRESGSTNAEVRKGSSEDHYFAVGPVLSWSFTKKPRSPFLEASVRGGIFRSTPAAIFIYDRPTGNNIYSVTATDRRYHAGLLATLGFFVPSKNGLWAWGVEAIGFRTKLDYIFPGATVYPFERKHGGFSAGLAMRRNFKWDIPVPKPATPPIICYAPELELNWGTKSLKGVALVTSFKDVKTDDPIKLTWKSRSKPDTAKTETFTARIHHLDNGVDQVIASVMCQEGNQLTFPASYIDSLGRPLKGQYYATVHSQSATVCSSCVSEASTTGFSVTPECPVDTTCDCRTAYGIEVFAYQTVKRSILTYKPSSPTCEGCICPADTVDVSRLVYRLLGTINKDICATDKALNYADEIKAANITIPAWVKDVYVAVETVTVGPKCPQPGARTKVNYKATFSKGTFGTFAEANNIVENRIQVKSKKPSKAKAKRKAAPKKK
jgi:hypothetical protein